MHDEFYILLQRIKPDKRLLELYREILIAEAINQLGSLNNKISRSRNQLDRIAENRLSAIRKFNNDQLSVDEKDDLLNALRLERMEISEQSSV